MKWRVLNLSAPLPHETVVEISPRQPKGADQHRMTLPSSEQWVEAAMDCHHLENVEINSEPLDDTVSDLVKKKKKLDFPDNSSVQYYYKYSSA